MHPPSDVKELVLGKVLARQARAYGNKTFLTEIPTGRQWTYAAMHAWSSQVCNALRAVQAEKGTHVGVLLGNSAEHVATFFGIGMLGAVAVQVNTAARGDLLRYYFDYADATILIVDEAHADRLVDVLPSLPKVRHVLVIGQAGQPPAPATLAHIGPLARDFGQLIAQSALTHTGDEVKCSDLLMFAFTSGTTGPSKGCMLPHAAALTFGTSAAEAQSYRDSDVFYICLPLFHNNALLASLGAALVCGSSVALTERFSVSRFWNDIREHGATITNLLGAMSSFLWNQPASAQDPDNQLRLVSTSPTPPYARDFEKRFNVRVMTNYGLSDFGIVTSLIPGKAPENKLGSIGVPRRNFELRIVDEDDFECPPGVHGEIVIRAKEPWRAAIGYYKMPESTLQAHRNQWFHTGDVGYRDADGYFWFVDRKKDCIRRRGENISAFEVERVILQHPGVASVAVFPVSTPDNDEEVGAAVILKPDARLQEQALVHHCAANMAYFMVPRYVQFLEALPTTTNQKVEKFRLRKALEDSLATVWDREKAGIRLQR